MTNNASLINFLINHRSIIQDIIFSTSHLQQSKTYIICFRGCGDIYTGYERVCIFILAALKL